MDYFLKQLFTIIFFIIITITNQERLTPLSKCTKGRISSYTGWENGGRCGFGPHTKAQSKSYLYPVSINQKFFNSYLQCGACYELVGPYGAIRVKVEDFCPENDESGLCNGDMYHFTVANDGSSYLMKDSPISYVTFRMVSCGISGNIRIIADQDIDQYSFAFIVLDHNLRLSKATIKEDDTSDWKNCERDSKSNKWKYESNAPIFPLKIRIYSINDDYVTIEVPSCEGGKIYEADKNFNVNTDNFFDIETLEKESKPENEKECCERDKSEFTPIYLNGELNNGYSQNNNKVTINFQSNELYKEKLSMSVSFKSFGELILQPNFPINAVQYSGVAISIKDKQSCTNCLKLRAYNLKSYEKELKINNEWKTFRFTFNELGIENNEFNGIAINYLKNTAEPYEINIGSIELLEVRNPPDVGICVDIQEEEGVTPTIPIVPPTEKTEEVAEETEKLAEETEEVTEETEEVAEETDILTNKTQNSEISSDTKETEPEMETTITILNIEKNTEIKEIITITCEPFKPKSNEKMGLFFITQDNSNFFETKSCILKEEEEISSFTCELPDNIPNGLFLIKSLPDNNYYIISKIIASCNNGDITFTSIDNIRTDSPEEIKEEDDIIIAINESIEQEIKEGNNVTIKISQVEEKNFSIKNDIIFTDEINSKYLYLKKCKGNSHDNFVTSLNCIVSNNLLRGTYTKLADVESNKQFVILPGCTINLKCQKSNGGFLGETQYNINATNLTKEELLNYSLTFNVLHYISGVNTGDIFPHQVFLTGIKLTSLTRRLQINNNKLNVTFNNCVYGSKSMEYVNVFESIKCPAPDFIPAGNYNQLEIEGFDNGPNSKINIVFEKDFNKSIYGKVESSQEKTIPKESIKKSTSKSKSWVIWLIACVLLAVLIGIAVVAFVVNRKEHGNVKNDGNNTTNRISDISSH